MIGIVWDSKSESGSSFKEKNAENHVLAEITGIALGDGHIVIAMEKNPI